MTVCISSLIYSRYPIISSPRLIATAPIDPIAERKATWKSLLFEGLCEWGLSGGSRKFLPFVWVRAVRWVVKISFVCVSEGCPVGCENFFRLCEWGLSGGLRKFLPFVWVRAVWWVAKISSVWRIVWVRAVWWVVKVSSVCRIVWGCQDTGWVGLMQGTVNIQVKTNTNTIVTDSTCHVTLCTTASSQKGNLLPSE